MTIISYQFDTKGFISGRLITRTIPPCVNQLVYPLDSAPDLRGKLYVPADQKVYAVQRAPDEYGRLQPVRDENGNYLIDEGEEPVDVPLESITFTP